MAIIVTGGCGFIGSNLIEKLLIEKNDEIINIDKLTYAGDSNDLHEFKENKRYHFIKGDICDKELILKILFKFKPSFVINCAAETHVDRSIINREPFIKSNILGTFNLLECIKSYYESLEKRKADNFRFLQISTDEVFGSLNENDNSFTELNAYKPSSPYSASKAAGDHLVYAYFKTFKLPNIIINSSNNYGPFQYEEKLIPLSITNALQGKNINLYGNGLNKRDWLYVNDHCEAIIKVLENGEIGNSYNVGGDCELTNIEVVRKICIYLDQLKPISEKNKNDSYLKLIKYIDDRPGHDYRYSINFSKINNKLNWFPRESFDSGIIKTINWYLLNLERKKNLKN
tara:strand:- start:33192 stop:34223 length:1032 start_codon:yes stop_codon:yes gene_type:complete